MPRNIKEEKSCSLAIQGEQIRPKFIHLPVSKWQNSRHIGAQLDTTERLSTAQHRGGNILFLFCHKNQIVIDSSKANSNWEDSLYPFWTEKAAVCSVMSESLQPTDYSPPGSSIHGIFQASILEQVAISSSRRPSCTRGQTCVSCVSCIDRCILRHWATREAAASALCGNGWQCLSTGYLW